MSEIPKPPEAAPEIANPQEQLMHKDEWREHLVEQIEKGNKHFGVIFIDLGNFKGVNDSYGHEYGDHVLQATSLVLADTVRKNNGSRSIDVVAHERHFSSDAASRYGGDEFALYCDLNPRTDSDTGISDTERLSEIIERLKSAFSDIIEDDERLSSVGFSASIGGAVHETGMDAKEILKAADEAMMLDKQEHRKAIWNTLSDEEQKAIKAAFLKPALQDALSKLGIRPPAIPIEADE